MSTPTSVKTLIIGAGPAGYTAGIYAARAALNPVLIAGLKPGGQLTETTDIENFPGFPEPLPGPQLMERMADQARHVGTDIRFDTVTRVDFSCRPFRIETDSGEIFIAESVIVATGAEARKLGLPSEEKFWGFGVSACATCDGFFYKNKQVAVIGGGDAAVEEALYLTHHASRVFLIHRRETLRAEKIMQERLFANPKVTFIPNKELLEIFGREEPALSVEGLRLRDTQNAAEETLKIDGVFVAIGHTPATELFQGQLSTDKAGYIVTKPGTPFTSVEGVFAAGDVQDTRYRQAVTAAGSGCMAAIEAEHFLSRFS